MAFNYNISWEGFVRVLTPINKRKDKFLSFVNVMVSPIQVWYTRLFSYYFPTYDYLEYSGSETYNSGDVVLYGYGVYECLEDSTSGVLPTVTDSWLKLQDNHIGAWERGKVKAGKISLEKYLNTFYRTSFNYPLSVNDIYIETNDNKLTQFYSSNDPLYSSVVTNGWEFTRYFGYDDFSVYSQNSFTVYVPAATWSVIADTDTKRANHVSNLISKYVPAGIQFNVTSY